MKKESRIWRMVDCLEVLGVLDGYLSVLYAFNVANHRVGSYKVAVYLHGQRF